MKAVVYICYAVLSAVFCFFFLLAISESETSAVIGVAFFVGCVFMYNSSKLANVIIKAYMKLSLRLANKVGQFLIK